MGTLLNTDFTEYDVDAQPRDWQRRFATTGGSFKVVAGAGRDGVKPGLQFIPGSAVRNGLSWDKIDALPDRDVAQILVSWTNTVASNVDGRTFFRGSGDATTSAAYVAGEVNNVDRVSKITGTAIATLLSGTAVAHAANLWWLSRTEILADNTIRSRTWLDDGTVTEPTTWPSTYTDVTTPYTGVGWSGVYQDVINGRTTWDRFAFASGGLTASFNSIKSSIITDGLGSSDTGVSAASVYSFVITDNEALIDSVVADVVNNFQIIITDKVGITDTRVVQQNFVRDIIITDSLALVDDVLQVALIPGAPDIPTDDQIYRGVEIINQLIAAGYTINTIMDRERARLLAKTGANPVGKTLQDLYYLAGERPRL